MGTAVLIHKNLSGIEAYAVGSSTLFHAASLLPLSTVSVVVPINEQRSFLAGANFPARSDGMGLGQLAPATMFGQDPLASSERNRNNYPARRKAGPGRSGATVSLLIGEKIPPV